MNQDAPEATLGGPRRPFRVQNRHLDEMQKIENLAIRAVSWHLRGFQKTTGPHLSGRQGGFKRRKELSHGAKHSSSTSSLRGATSGQNATCNNASSNPQKSPHFADAHRVRKSGSSSEASRNSIEVPASLSRQSCVGNRQFDTRTKFEKIKT